MRLINAETRRLEEFFESRVPQYAILSHCWGEEEVLFQDMNTQDWRDIKKAGSRKIDYACKAALKNAIGHVWVDTCCIDKSSSAELSEAINSMYRWYKNARVCWVYLEDFEFKERDRPRLLQRPCSFRLSRWFTRGWTIQELLAPHKVKFYDQLWRYFGDKDELARPISEITNIPERFLINRSLVPSASIAQKMSWAAGRETTREEDLAYCLLGLHDVHMPLLYGEGSKAFIRLQEEILRSSDDQSLFAWVDPGYYPKSNGILAGSPRCFKNAGSIIPLPTSSSRQPHSLSNKGLLIEIDVRPIDEPGMGFRGILDCQYEYDYTSSVSILLDDVSGTKGVDEGVFKRRRGAPLELVGMTDAQTAPATTKLIKIIKDESSSVAQGNFGLSVCIVASEIGKHGGYEIVETYPRSASWFPKQRTLIYTEYRAKSATWKAGKGYMNILKEYRWPRQEENDIGERHFEVTTREFGFAFANLKKNTTFYVAIQVWKAEGCKTPSVTLQAEQVDPKSSLEDWCCISPPKIVPNFISREFMVAKFQLREQSGLTVDVRCGVVVAERLRQSVLLLHVNV